MSRYRTSSDTNFKETFVSKLSPNDSSLEGLLAKLAVAWAGWFGGVTLSDVFTFASIVYVALNIFVLVRDKIVEPRRMKMHHDKDKQEYDMDQTSGE
jgi:p-aminobenzoyl-glutamate transporter AbgT